MFRKESMPTMVKIRGIFSNRPSVLSDRLERDKKREEVTGTLILPTQIPPRLESITTESISVTVPLEGGSTITDSMKKPPIIGRIHSLSSGKGLELVSIFRLPLTDTAGATKEREGNNGTVIYERKKKRTSLLSVSQGSAGDKHPLHPLALKIPLKQITLSPHAETASTGEGHGQGGGNGGAFPENIFGEEEPSLQMVLNSIIRRHNEAIGQAEDIDADRVDVTERTMMEFPSPNNDIWNLAVKLSEVKEEVSVGPSNYVNVGYYGLDTGQFVFYPELVRPNEIAILTAAASSKEEGHKNPFLQKLIKSQQKVLQEEGLAQDIISSTNRGKSQLSIVAIDEISGYHLRFAKDFIVNPPGFEKRAKVVLQISGAFTPGLPDRYPIVIELASMKGADPIEGYIPNNEVFGILGQEAYEHKIAPLIAAMLQAEKKHPKLDLESCIVPKKNKQ